MEKVNVDDIFDSLAVECGEIIKENEKPVIITNKDAMKKAMNDNLNKYAYESEDMPMPGQSVSVTIGSSPEQKTNGINSVLAQAALLKAEKATESLYAKEKREKEEKEKKARRDNIITQFMYQQEEAFFIKNKFRMSGQEKRKLRRIIEKKYDAGKFDSFLNSDTIPLN